MSGSAKGKMETNPELYAESLRHGPDKNENRAVTPRKAKGAQ